VHSDDSRLVYFPSAGIINKRSEETRLYRRLRSSKMSRKLKLISNLVPKSKHPAGRVRIFMAKLAIKDNGVAAIEWRAQMHNGAKLLFAFPVSHYGSWKDKVQTGGSCGRREHQE